MLSLDGGNTPPITRKIYHEWKKRRCISDTTCREVREVDRQWSKQDSKKPKDG